MSSNPAPRVPPKVVPPKAVAPRSQPVETQDAAPAEAEAPAVGTPAPKRVFEGDVVARGASYYRTTRYIMVVLLLAMGGWFGYDGFKGWPAENAEIAAVSKKLEAAKKDPDPAVYEAVARDPLAHKPLHSDFDILLQKFLAFGLPVLSGCMLAWALYNSRGEYRLSGERLSIPGQPTVQFQDILEIDKHLWDRKGIAYIICKTNSGKVRLRLDDFIYDRDPTDEIYKRALAYLESGEETAKAAAATRMMSDRTPR